MKNILKQKIWIGILWLPLVAFAGCPEKLSNVATRLREYNGRTDILSEMLERVSDPTQKEVIREIFERSNQPSALEGYEIKDNRTALFQYRGISYRINPPNEINDLWTLEVREPDSFFNTLVSNDFKVVAESHSPESLLTIPVERVRQYMESPEGKLWFHPTARELRGRLELDKARSDIQRVINVRSYPEHNGRVNPETVAQDLAKTLSPAEVKLLTDAFHGVLVAAAKGENISPDFPNAQFVKGFAQDNVNHVSLIYRALEKAAGDNQTRYQLPLDIALMVAAAHDLGKVGGMLKDFQGMELLTAEQRAVYKTIFPSVVNPETGFPGADFMAGHILAHDTLSGLIVENLIKHIGKKEKWSEEKIKSVSELLQTSFARHNAGYAPELAGNHFWATNWPQYATRMQQAGFKVDPNYAQVQGSGPAVMAAVDRQTSLHPSFVEKIAGQGNFEWSAQSVAGLLKGNAVAVESEIDNIGTVLDKHDRSGSSFQTSQLRDAGNSQKNAAILLGENISEMNDFSNTKYPSRPPKESIKDQKGYVLFFKNGTWSKVSNEATLEIWNEGSGSWESRPVSSSLTGKKASILLQQVIGYEPIDTSPPRLTGLK